MMVDPLVIQGQIRLANDGEGIGILFVGDDERPFAEIFEEELQGKQVTVRYWVSDQKTFREDLELAQIAIANGLVDAEFGHAYSDMTGYLWTDEECMVGGHDLLQELESYVGKWLFLEAQIHDEVSR